MQRVLTIKTLRLIILILSIGVLLEVAFALFALTQILLGTQIRVLTPFN